MDPAIKLIAGAVVLEIVMFFVSTGRKALLQLNK